jgi:hypothetical protein
MTICYCSPCLVVSTFNPFVNSRFSSICSIVALSIMNECLILPLFPVDVLLNKNTGLWEPVVLSREYLHHSSPPVPDD